MRIANTLALILFSIAASAAEPAVRVFKDRVTPHWFGNNSKFWYENELAGGTKEFIVVDAGRGLREKVEKAPEETSAEPAAEARRRHNESASNEKSPNGKWTVFTRDQN